MLEYTHKPTLWDRFKQVLFAVFVPLSLVGAMACALAGAWLDAIQWALLYFVSAEETRRWFPQFFQDAPIWHTICWNSWRLLYILLTIEAFIDGEILWAVIWIVLGSVVNLGLLAEEDKVERELESEWKKV